MKDFFNFKYFIKSRKVIWVLLKSNMTGINWNQSLWKAKSKWVFSCSACFYVNVYWDTVPCLKWGLKLPKKRGFQTLMYIRTVSDFGSLSTSWNIGKSLFCYRTFKRGLNREWSNLGVLFSKKCTSMLILEVALKF